MSSEAKALVGDPEVHLKPDSALKVRTTASDNLAIERWTETLSPRERTSISKANIDPCVRKAVSNLQDLKRSLEEWGDEQKWEEGRGEGGRVRVGTATTGTTTTTSDYLSSAATHTRPTSVRINDREYSDLSIEGFQTGTVLEKLGKANKVLNLFIIILVLFHISSLLAIAVQWSINFIECAEPSGKNGAQQTRHTEIT